MRRWTWVVIGCIFTGIVVNLGGPDLWAAPPQQIEKDLFQKKKHLKSIRKELSETRGKEKEIRGKESSILERLSAIETDLYRKEKELKQMERQLGLTQGRLEQTGNQIIMLNQGIDTTRGEFFSRLTALYKMGRIPPETLLLSSGSYLDLLRIDKYFRVILESDTRIVDTHLHQVTLKERYQDSLLRDQSQWQRAIAEVTKKREEVKQVKEEQRALLRSIQNQKSVYRKVILELETRAIELQTLVEKLEKEKNLLAYGKTKSDYGKTKSDYMKAPLITPVQGKVISAFREKGQNGIEIKAPVGAEIRAVLSGRVLYADWFKGFGNVVIIDHGDHLFTVSGYSSQLLKKTGDSVAQGEPVALVGSSGSLKGPCLYFEIRHRGKPQNPTEWIPQLEKGVSASES
jgi:septal ring factor EnvC (AmiA/AmiB activator)